jgi:hypothetical protein
LSLNVETKYLLSSDVRGTRATVGLNIDGEEAALQSKQNHVSVTLEIENIHDVVLVDLHSLSLKSRSPAISFMGRPSANI